MVAELTIYGATLFRVKSYKLTIYKTGEAYSPNSGDIVAHRLQIDKALL